MNHHEFEVLREDHFEIAGDLLNFLACDMIGVELLVDLQLERGTHEKLL